MALIMTRSSVSAISSAISMFGPLARPGSEGCRSINPGCKAYCVFVRSAAVRFYRCVAALTDLLPEAVEGQFSAPGRWPFSGMFGIGTHVSEGVDYRFGNFVTVFSCCFVLRSWEPPSAVQ